MSNASFRKKCQMNDFSFYHQVYSWPLHSSSFLYLFNLLTFHFWFQMFSYFFNLFKSDIFNLFASFYRSHCLRRTRRNSDTIESVPLISTEPTYSEEDWLNNIPLTIPLELASNFKSGEDWLDNHGRWWQFHINRFFSIKVFGEKSRKGFL